MSHGIEQRKRQLIAMGYALSAHYTICEILAKMGIPVQTRLH